MSWYSISDPVVRMPPGSPPVVLSIAGSDPSGGAGIQADLKTFGALGAYGCAALTALTAQSTQGVTGVHLVPAAFVREQVETLVADVQLDAVKIGMLASAEIVQTVGSLIGDAIRCAVVLDPVMVSTSGSRLLDDDAVEAMRRLVHLADVITPNLGEAAVLLGTSPAVDVEEMHTQAIALREQLGASSVLLKGGHGTGSESVDVWADLTGTAEFSAPRIDTQNTHGTGCSLSSAIAALRPVREDWTSAIRDAKDWLTGALASPQQLDIGSGHGPINHFHNLWPPNVG